TSSLPASLFGRSVLPGCAPRYSAQRRGGGFRDDVDHLAAFPPFPELPHRPVALWDDPVEFVHDEVVFTERIQGRAHPLYQRAQLLTRRHRSATVAQIECPT